MHLLVTTSRSFLLVDTDRNESISLDRGRGLYYGIADAGDRIFVAARNRLISSAATPAEERGEILIFDRALQACGSLQAPFALRDLHGIGWHEHRLWATCSRDNMVAIWDGVRWEAWFPLAGNVDEAVDVYHFNSLMFDRGRVWVLAHNWGASELLAFSVETRELIDRLPLGRCGHNIWLQKNQLFTCSSADGQLLGNCGFSLETGGFPRGVAFDDKSRCVGISELAERQARDFTTGKLMLFDRDWKFQKEISLSGEGLILDIQCLPAGYQFGDQTKPRKSLMASPPNPVFARIPAFDSSDAGALNDSFYRDFEDRHRGSRAIIKSQQRAYLPFIQPLITLAPHATAIDLGCGRGEWLEVLAETGFDACGVDLDAGMLAACREQGLDARRADALQVLADLPNESMALVSAFHVVEHISFNDARALVREALRVLKPGGLLILETPNPGNLVVGASAFYVDPSHVRPIPSELLGFVVEHAGFYRHVVAGLQESPALHSGTTIGLISVLAGVSPDYAVIAQKRAAPELLAGFDHAFGTKHGITLAAIAHLYETQEANRLGKINQVIAESITRADQRAEHHNARLTAAETRLAQVDDHFIHQFDRIAHLDNGVAYLDDRITHLVQSIVYLGARDAQGAERAAQLEDRIRQLEFRQMEADERAMRLGQELLAIHASHSWRLTAPLRWLTAQVARLRRDGLIARLQAAAKQVVSPPAGDGCSAVDANPNHTRQPTRADDLPKDSSESERLNHVRPALDAPPSTEVLANLDSSSTVDAEPPAAATVQAPFGEAVTAGAVTVEATVEATLETTANAAAEVNLAALGAEAVHVSSADDAHAEELGARARAIFLDLEAAIAENKRHS